MVGRRGVEPRDTRLSGRPRRPAGSRPAEAEGVEPPRPKLARVQAGCSLQSASASMSGEGESRTRKAEAQLLSGQIPSPIGLPLHGGRRRTRISGPSGPTRFPDGDHHLVISSPTAESGELESHGVTRALVSSEARHPGRFALRSAPRIRTEITQGLDLLALPIGLERLKSDRPDSNRPCDLGKVMC